MRQSKFGRRDCRGCPGNRSITWVSPGHGSRSAERQLLQSNASTAHSVANPSAPPALSFGRVPVLREAQDKSLQLDLKEKNLAGL